MSSEKHSAARLPPRWFIVLAWYTHRALYRVSRGRAGLWQPKDSAHWGTMRLTVTGRRTGRARSVLLGYFEDGPNLVTLAMNGWGEGEPAWWLNLLANPDATVELKGGFRTVRGRAAGEPSVRGCGSSGGSGSAISMVMPPCAPGRRPSWSWNRAPRVRPPVADRFGNGSPGFCCRGRQSVSR